METVHFLSLLCFHITCYVPVQGITTSCEAPSVYLDEPATVTCIFSEDINTTRTGDFRVYRYGASAQDEEVVLDCYWVTQANCKAAAGYIFDGEVSNRLVITIPEATQEFVGTYECQVEPTDAKRVEDCRFDLKYGVKPQPTSKSPPTSTSQKTEPQSTYPGVFNQAGSANEESSVNAAAVVIPIILIVLLVVGGVVAYHFRKRIRKRYPNFLVCDGRRNSALTNEQTDPLNTDTRTNDSEAVYLDPKGEKALFIKSQEKPEEETKAHPTTSTPDTILPTTVSVISEQKGEEENNKTRSSAEYRREKPVKDSDNKKEICQLAPGTQVETEKGTVPAGLDKETTENNLDAPDRTQEADVVSGHTQENALCSEGNAVAGATDDTLRENAQSVDDADTGRNETVTRNNEHRAGRTPVAVTSPNQREVTTADFDLLGNKSPEAEARLEWNEVGDTGDTQIGVKSTSSDQGRDVDVDQARSQSAEAEENSQPADGKADTDTADSTDDTVDAAQQNPPLMRHCYLQSLQTAKKQT